MNPLGFARIVAADVRGRRLLGTVVFVVVVALAAAGIIAGLESRRSASDIWDDAFERAQAPHVILHAADRAALEEPSADPRVVASSFALETNGDLVLDTDREALVIRSPLGDEDLLVGAPYLRDGRLATSPTDIAFEESVADDLGVDIGDEATIIRADGATTTFSVVGIVLDFQDCFFPQCDPGVAWVDAGGMERLGGASSVESLLRLEDPLAAPAFTSDVLATYGDRLGGAQDWLDTRRDSLAVSRFFGVFLAGFGLFLLIAAGVVVAGSVTNRMLARRRDIGLLKAVGVTPRQVTGMIAAEHLVLAGVGLVLGWLLAFAITPSLRIGVTAVLESGSRRVAAGSTIVAAVALAAIVLVSTVLPGLGTGRTTTAAALRPPVAGAGRSRIARLARSAGAGPVVVSGLKDAFGRPLRSALAALSIVLAVVALIITLALDSAVDRTVENPALTGDPWDVTASVPGMDMADVVAAIDATPGVDAWFFEQEERRVVDGEVLLVRAVGGDAGAAKYVIHEGRDMQGVGEALAGYGLLERLDKRVGDTVDLDIDGQVVPLTIVGRYGETDDSGEVLQTRWESIERFFPGAEPETYRVVAAGGVSRSQLATDLAARLGPEASVQALVVETEDLDAFGVAFMIVASLVLVVALANLGSTILLGVRERLRDFGVLRAIGFTPSQLVASTTVATFALTLVAVVVGVPLGLWASDLLQRSVGEAIGYGPELATAPDGVLTAVAIALIVLVALAIGAVTCVRSAGRSASELIRYE